MGISLYDSFVKKEMKREHNAVRHCMLIEKLEVIPSLPWGLYDTVVLGVACDTEATTQPQEIVCEQELEIHASGCNTAHVSETRGLSNSCL